MSKRNQPVSRYADAGGTASSASAAAAALKRTNRHSSIGRSQRLRSSLGAVAALLLCVVLFASPSAVVRVDARCALSNDDPANTTIVLDTVGCSGWGTCNSRGRCKCNGGRFEPGGTPSRIVDDPTCVHGYDTVDWDFAVKYVIATCAVTTTEFVITSCAAVLLIARARVRANLQTLCLALLWTSTAIRMCGYYTLVSLGPSKRESRPFEPVFLFLFLTPDMLTGIVFSMVVLFLFDLSRDQLRAHQQEKSTCRTCTTASVAVVWACSTAAVIAIKDTSVYWLASEVILLVIWSCSLLYWSCSLTRKLTRHRIGAASVVSVAPSGGAKDSSPNHASTVGGTNGNASPYTPAQGATVVVIPPRPNAGAGTGGGTTSNVKPHTPQIESAPPTPVIGPTSASLIPGPKRTMTVNVNAASVAVPIGGAGGAASPMTASLAGTVNNGSPANGTNSTTTPAAIVSRHQRERTRLVSGILRLAIGCSVTALAIVAFLLYIAAVPSSSTTTLNIDFICRVLSMVWVATMCSVFWPQQQINKPVTRVGPNSKVGAKGGAGEQNQPIMSKNGGAVGGTGGGGSQKGQAPGGGSLNRGGSVMRMNSKIGGSNNNNNKTEQINAAVHNNTTPSNPKRRTNGTVAALPPTRESIELVAAPNPAGGASGPVVIAAGSPSLKYAVGGAATNSENSPLLRLGAGADASTPPAGFTRTASVGGTPTNANGTISPLDSSNILTPNGLIVAVPSPNHAAGGGSTSPTVAGSAQVRCSPRAPVGGVGMVVSTAGNNSPFARGRALTVNRPPAATATTTAAAATAGSGSSSNLQLHSSSNSPKAAGAPASVIVDTPSIGAAGPATNSGSGSSDDAILANSGVTLTPALAPSSRLPPTIAEDGEVPMSPPSKQSAIASPASP